jgi:hypothetical protein
MMTEHVREGSDIDIHVFSDSVPLVAATESPTGRNDVRIRFRPDLSDYEPCDGGAIPQFRRVMK